MVTVPDRQRRRGLLVLVAAVLVAAACNTETPLERLERQLDQYPEYRVTLQDMREDGYWHQYGVVIGEPQAGSEDLVYRDSIRDFEQVGRRTYAQYQPHLGMVILSKGPEGIDRNQHPPATSRWATSGMVNGATKGAGVRSGCSTVNTPC